MLRAVIDTSTLVSYLLTRSDLLQRIVAHWRANAFAVLSSPQTRAELASVLARPQIQRLTVTPLDPLIQGLERYTWHVPGTLELPGACRDPKDDKFLACAVEGEAHYLVSSDRDLLSMRAFRDVAIVNPGQFLLALELYSLSDQELAKRFDRETLEGIHQTLSLEPDTRSRLVAAIGLSPQP